MLTFPASLAVLSWVLFSIGVLIVIARIASRVIDHNSLQKLWYQDYLMLFLTVIYALDMWAINEVAVNGSNYMSAETAAALDEKGVERAIWGSKMTLVTEVFTLTIIWGVKACLCMLYLQLTSRLGWKHMAVKFIAGYCAFSYVLIMIMYFSYWCRPFSGYWAVPVVHSQCATYYHHMIFATAFNILADLLLLYLPLSLLPTLRIPRSRKLILYAVLSLGVFNILAAVLNRYYNFAHPNSVQYLNWYVGEVATAMFVANIPYCWPLVRVCLKIGPWSGGRSTGQGGGGRGGEGGAGGYGYTGQGVSTFGNKSMQASVVGVPSQHDPLPKRMGGRRGSKLGCKLGRTESQEELAEAGSMGVGATTASVSSAGCDSYRLDDMDVGHPGQQSTSVGRGTGGLHGFTGWMGGEGSKEIVRTVEIRQSFK